MNSLIIYLRTLTAEASNGLRSNWFREPAVAWNLIPLEAQETLEQEDVRETNERSPGGIGRWLPQSLLGDGFLWAVQKRRRTVERRLQRKFGVPEWGPKPGDRPHWKSGDKMIRPKANIISCPACGDFHEAQYICPHCYDKVRQESKAIQEAIVNEYRFDPVDKDVRLVYKDDPRGEQRAENLRTVEVPKERPSWFAQNLLSKTGQGAALSETGLIADEKKVPSE